MRQALGKETVDRVRATLLSTPQEFRAEWLAGQNKVVVPFEPPLKLSAEFAGRICAAFATGGSGIAWGVSSGTWEGMRPHDGVVVDLASDEVTAWHDEFMPFDMVLVTPDLSRAALFGQDEVGLVAGPAAVVETFLGTSLEAARRAFVEYAADMSAASRHLPGIAARYGCT